jgi:phytoene synthase
MEQSSASHDIGYCGALLQQYDKDRFYLGLLADEHVRPSLWALFAFQHEIAKTREVVTETTMGLIRLQWWRDGIGEIYDGKPPRANEVLPPLAQAIKKYDLKRADLDALVYAREFDLEDMIPADMKGMIHYAEYTNAPLNRLALQVLDATYDNEIVETLSTAYGLCGLLYAAPFHAAQRRCYLPANLLAKHKMSERDLYEFKNWDTALAPVVQDIATKAHALIDSVSNKPVPLYLRRLRLISSMKLKTLKNAHYNLLDSRLTMPPPLFHLRLAIGR